MSSIKQFFADQVARIRRDGSFANNFAVVFSGTGLNIMVQIILAPILTRLYGPVAYGIYSIFNAVCTNLAPLATLRLPQAFLLPKQDEDFYVLMRLTVLSSTFFSLLTFLVLAVAGGPVLQLLNAEKLEPYYYLIPIMIWLTAINQIFGTWQHRLRVFKKTVAISTGVLVGVRLFNFVFGWVTKGGVFGLVIGDMLGKASGLLFSWRLIIRDKVRFFFSPIPIKRLKEVLVEYRQYPLYNLPGTWCMLVADQLPVFFISSTYGLKTLGLFSLAVSMLDLPKRLFAYSMSSVFYRKAVDVNNESPEALKHFVVRMLYVLFGLSILPYSTVFVFGPQLYAFFFGVQWEMSGILAAYLALYFVFELLYASMDSLYYVLRVEHRMLFFQVTTLAGRFLILLSTSARGLPVEAMIGWLVAFNAALYLTQICYVLYLLKISWQKHMAILLALSAVTIGALLGCRELFYMLF